MADAIPELEKKLRSVIEEIAENRADRSKAMELHQLPGVTEEMEKEELTMYDNIYQRLSVEYDGCRQRLRELGVSDARIKEIEDSAHSQYKQKRQQKADSRRTKQTEASWRANANTGKDLNLTIKKIIIGAAKWAGLGAIVLRYLMPIWGIALGLGLAAGIKGAVDGWRRTNRTGTAIVGATVGLLAYFGGGFLLNEFFNKFFGLSSPTLGGMDGLTQDIAHITNTPSWDPAVSGRTWLDIWFG